MLWVSTLNPTSLMAVIGSFPLVFILKVFLDFISVFVFVKTKVQTKFISANYFLKYFYLMKKDVYLWRNKN